MDRRSPAVALAISLSLPLLLAACLAGAGRSTTPPVVASPGGSHPPAPSGSPAASTAPLSAAALKLRLIDTLGPLWYCDPDEYPVARDDEATLAAQRFGEVRADTEAWTAIAASLGLDPAGASPAPDARLAAYRLWKQLRAIQLTPSGAAWAFDLRVGPRDAAGTTGERITGTIADDGAITVASREPAGPPNCPICLGRATPILTPWGPVAVADLRPGDVVWTLDATGRRIPAAVLEVASVPVSATHRLVRVVLADGRAVEASPGHPLPDGRPIGSLRPGDRVAGSVVTSAELVPYAGGRTFDLRVAGPTGTYLAGGGIPLASTLDR